MWGAGSEGWESAGGLRGAMDELREVREWTAEDCWEQHAKAHTHPALVSLALVLKRNFRTRQYRQSQYFRVIQMRALSAPDPGA